MAAPIRSPISPMFGHSPAISPHAIRTGSWLAREALTNARGLRQCAAAAFCGIAAALSLASSAAHAGRGAHPPRHAHGARPVPYPRLDWPLEISGSQYAPVAWTDIAGWTEDDHLKAYRAFRLSCRPIAAQ